MSLCNLTIQMLEANGYNAVTGICPVPDCGLPVARHRDGTAQRQTFTNEYKGML
jgi:hypothetical protein